MAAAAGWDAFGNEVADDLFYGGYCDPSNLA